MRACFQPESTVESLLGNHIATANHVRGKPRQRTHQCTDQECPSLRSPTGQTVKQRAGFDNQPVVGYPCQPSQNTQQGKDGAGPGAGIGEFRNIEIRLLPEQERGYRDGRTGGAQCGDGNPNIKSTDQFLQHEHRSGYRGIEGHGETGTGSRCEQGNPIRGWQPENTPQKMARLRPFERWDLRVRARKPPPIANRPPMNLMGSNSRGAAGNSPSITASTWGIPLPAAGCPDRCTSQAAKAVVAATVAQTRTKPSTGHWWAQVIVSVRAVFM